MNNTLQHIEVPDWAHHVWRNGRGYMFFTTTDRDEWEPIVDKDGKWIIATAEEVDIWADSHRLSFNHRGPDWDYECPYL